MPTYPVAPNNIGLTRYIETEGPWLADQLAQQGIAFERVGLPHLVGMAGTAYTLSYISKLSNQPITVLCVPHRADIDDFSEEYFYFEGMSLADALAKGESWWIEEVYHKRRELVP